MSVPGLPLGATPPDRDPAHSSAAESSPTAAARPHGGAAQLRLLILSPDYATEPAAKRLFQELAEELCRRGHSTDMLVLESSGRLPAGDHASTLPGLRVFQVPGWERGFAARLGPLRYLFQAARVRLDPRVRRFLASHYDGCVFATPGVLAGGLPGALRKRHRLTISAMIMWDFFPIANVEIGALPGGWISRLLYRLERSIVVGQDAFALMTSRGGDFLDRYYGRVAGRRIIIPPWGVDRRPAGDPPKRDRFTIVWGGQITHGRALDDLIHVLADEAVAAAKVELIVAGDGPAKDRYQDLARSLGATNIRFLGRLSGDDYARELSSCQAGASFMTEMAVPSFPSKTIDYFRAGLPVLAAVETGTDFGEILCAAGAGIAVPAGDRAAMVAAVLELANADPAKRAAMSAAARAFFEAELDVRVAAARFEALLRGPANDDAEVSLSADG